jgi:hypothetical protein
MTVYCGVGKPVYIKFAFYSRHLYLILDIAIQICRVSFQVLKKEVYARIILFVETFFLIYHLKQPCILTLTLLTWGIW